MVEQLKEAYRTFPEAKYGEVKLIAAPYSRMESRIAILSWGRALFMEDFDRELALKFYRRYADRGPEDAP